MQHVTCAFSAFGVQNVVPNGSWSVTATRQKAECMERLQKTE